MLTENINKTIALSFGTKAETLARLKAILQNAIIPDLIFISIRDWNANQANIINEIMSRFPNQSLAIRSSAINEDGAESSMAGAFLSLLNIDSNDSNAIASAITNIADSMANNHDNQILIQAMIENANVSGVIMTFDVLHGAPYYCIDYDDESGRTDIVTGGSGIHKSLCVYRESSDSYIKSPRILALLQLARELETVFNCNTIDIEFAIDNAGQLYLLQVRRITVASNWHPVTERRVKRQLEFVERFVYQHCMQQAGIYGNSNILAMMPDWNPAEIIGTTPRPLAVSLYQHLITSNVWRDARAIMGYRALPAVDLMVMINHHPYIDVRNSFNSFLPANLDQPVAEKLIDAYLARLNENPEFHDKVEFEIVPTCLNFTFEKDFTARYAGLLTNDEYQQYESSLTQLTRECLSGKSLESAIQMSATLNQLLDNYQRPDKQSNYLTHIKHLLDTCKELGSLAFAIVARHAFIAESLLRSAVTSAALTHERLIEFKRSIHTITSTMINEYALACNTVSLRDTFLAKYGHLRPGTYEVTSKRYDERHDLFANESTTLPSQSEQTHFTLTKAERDNLNQLLNDHQLETINADKLLDYAKLAIAEREHVKFIFTRALSNALAMLVEWGSQNGISRDDLSYLEWSEIVKSLSHPIMDDPDRHYIAQADVARKKYSACHAFKLAHLISAPRDIYVATQNRSKPNFVGLQHTIGQPIFLDSNSATSIELQDKIVCIQNADPGFDWIFTKKPAALVTQFGGANSHMAIRCTELGLPAAIGCGEQIFERIITARTIEINCEQKIIRPLHGN